MFSSALPENAAAYDAIVSEVEKHLSVWSLLTTEDEKRKTEKKVLFPLPCTDFDPTEVACAWHILTKTYNISVYFASSHPSVPFAADAVTLKGEKVKDSFLLSTVFSLSSLGVTEEVKKMYAELEKDEKFQHPIDWDKIGENEYDGIYLAGGHAHGMRQYLESQILMEKIQKFWALKRPLAAVCHGVLLAARTKDESGKSILFGKKATSLTNSQETTAIRLTSFWLGSHYQTYNETTEDEVKRHLYNKTTPAEVEEEEEQRKKSGQPLLYDAGPFHTSKSNDFSKMFIMEDGDFLSGRWPGDVPILAHRFAQKVLQL